MESVFPIAVRRVTLRTASDPRCCCSAPMGSHLFVSGWVLSERRRQRIPSENQTKSAGEIIAHFGLSTPKSLISCGTTSESTTEPLYSHYQGNRGFKQRKMDLEGIQSKSAHTSRLVHSTPLHVPPPEPSALSFFSLSALPPPLLLVMLAAARL